jgi:hypothetical protein
VTGKVNEAKQLNLSENEEGEETRNKFNFIKRFSHSIS